MLMENGHKKLYLVHRLVAETFVENPYNYDIVNHIDGNKRNNNYQNLEWCTLSHNQRHAIKLGLRKTGFGFPIYSESEKNYIQSHCWESSAVIAKHIGRSISGVKNYLRIYRKQNKAI